jgi:GTPase SAR1 family protein
MLVPLQSVKNSIQTQRLRHSYYDSEMSGKEFKVILAGAFGSGRTSFASSFVQAKRNSKKIGKSYWPWVTSEPCLTKYSCDQDGTIPNKIADFCWTCHLRLVRFAIACQRRTSTSGIFQIGGCGSGLL